MSNYNLVPESNELGSLFKLFLELFFIFLLERPGRVNDRNKRFQIWFYVFVMDIALLFVNKCIVTNLTICKIVNIFDINVIFSLLA